MRAKGPREKVTRKKVVIGTSIATQVSGQNEKVSVIEGAESKKIIRPDIPKSQVTIFEVLNNVSQRDDFDKALESSKVDEELWGLYKQFLKVWIYWRMENPDAPVTPEKIFEDTPEDMKQFLEVKHVCHMARLFALGKRTTDEKQFINFSIVLDFVKSQSEEVAKMLSSDLKALQKQWSKQEKQLVKEYEQGK